jgi:hypothetical protein
MTREDKPVRRFDAGTYYAKIAQEIGSQCLACGVTGKCKNRYCMNNPKYAVPVRRK